MTHETIINVGAGGTWDIVAPDSVTIAPTVDQAGITTGLRIFADLTYDEYIASQTNASIHFLGPVTNPTGTPQPGQSFPGLILQTTFEIRNDLGVPMTGVNLTLANDDASTIPGRDTANAHPDDYAHFHQILSTSFTDKLTGTVDPSLKGFDPTLQPAFLGPPQGGKNSPNIIDTFGVVQPDAIGHLGGANPNGTFTLHSEDTPGPTGGSFTLSWFTLDADPVAPDANTVRVFSKAPVSTQVADHAGDGKNYVMAGISSASIDLPSLYFVDGSTNAIGGVKVAGSAVEPTVFGDVFVGEKSSVSMANGLEVSHGTLTVEEAASTSHLTLEGKSTITGQGTVSITSADNAGRVTLNGDLTLADDDSNFLTIGAHLDGKGMMFISAAHDTVSVNAVDSGVTINDTAGTLNINHPTDFHGILAPITTSAVINLLQTTDVTHADFDSASGMLHLLTQSGADRGDIHISGNASGITLNRALTSDSFITLRDNGGTGNIAIKFA